MSFLALSLILLGGQAGHISPTDPNVLIPASSVPSSLPFNLYNHTNTQLPIGVFGDPSGVPPILPYTSSRGPLFQGSGGFTPANIRGAYGVTGSGSGVICIIDAYNYPNALNDFNVFATQYGLPKETSTNVLSSSNQVFQVVYSDGNGGTTTTAPANNASWNEEEALDIEWAHAMAPSAKIILVEAPNTGGGLFGAVQTAAAISGCREISMSWGGSESSAETSYDGTYFGTRSIVYFAASGDTGGQVIYPSSSPNVIACGGTSLTLSGNTWSSESAWSSGGGGQSSVEPLPSYQSGLSAYSSSGSAVTLTKRSTPDIAAVGNPNTGVWIYDSISYQGYVNWFPIGGTSAATPILAGIHNSSTTIHRSSEWFWIYDDASIFHDITSGSNGYKAGTGYDFCTGMGTPKSGQSL